jgi:hypothetical protein
MPPTLSPRPAGRSRRWYRFGAAALLLAPAEASAHFVLRAPASWRAQDSLGSPQKAPPCGNEGSAPETGIVTAFHTGDTITITIDETIYHPGHYRVALAINDQSELPDVPPVTPGQTACGSAPIQNPPVFPVIADGVLVHSAPFGSQRSFQVTLPPGVTCERCTLQVIEFMSNHGLNNPGGCFYHHCANISISDEVAGGGTGGQAGNGAAGQAGGGTGGQAGGGAGGQAGSNGGAGGQAGHDGGAGGNDGGHSHGGEGGHSPGGDGGQAGGGAGGSNGGGASGTGEGGTSAGGTSGAPNASGAGGAPNAGGTGNAPNTSGAGGAPGGGNAEAPSIQVVDGSSSGGCVAANPGGTTPGFAALIGLCVTAGLLRRRRH